ncbi:MAG: hypothetical protein Fur0018_18640 [Anaerolineales bacterium]
MQISWECGSAYDFFTSLHVLHDPERFGLRGAWAAGVRSRLPLEARKVLEQADQAFFVPLHWIHALPEPRSAAIALQHLAAIPAAKRLAALFFSPSVDEAMRALLRGVAQRGQWSDDDLTTLRSMRKEKNWNTQRDVLEGILSAWAAQETFGERLLPALQTYHEVFFDEEENRILPALEQALKKARELSTAIPAAQLLETLSQGVRFSTDLLTENLILVPSYWLSPLVIFQRVSADTWLLLFGGRPDDVSLVPGELVPDALLRVLKALSDPTRLRILRYISHTPMTPSALARKLRLRAPTVVHHLNILRLAGLVYLNLDIAGNKNERLYVARLEMVQQSLSLLETFLSGNETEE